jgi:hypothetical protein
MAEKSLNSQLYDAVAELAQRGDEHRLAALRAAEASRAETHALNRVNEAQAAFDKLVAQVKNAAPRSSDWKRPRGEPG